MADWASDYFEHGYAQRWGVLPVTERIRQDTACLWRGLQLKPRARVVDLGCGHGRYALAFAEHGADVVGVDSAGSLLRDAQRLGSESGLRAHWVQGDMRGVPLRRGSCDAAAVMDAFGFFEAEDDNERVLAEAARVLVPGGRLALKVVNGEPILARFRHADREERDGVVVALSRSLTLEPPRMVEQVSVSGARGKGQYERRQRLYRAGEVLAAARRAGFAIVEVFADACGAAFAPAMSPTMWLVGQSSDEGLMSFDMRLVMPSVQWQSAFVDMARECESAGDARYALALGDFGAYLRKIDEGGRVGGLPDGWVPGTEFWLEHDGRIVGCVRLRFGLTPDLEHEGGHVGYDVRPSMRRRGYGTALLRLALTEARARGIGRVRVTCDDDNVGSIKVIERNGGALEGRGVSKKTGRTVRQYWIE